jgi:hypothetical protein
LGEKEELEKILNENNIKIATITKTKKKHQGTKNTRTYVVTYSGVLGIHAPTEDKENLSEQFYEELQKVLDEANKMIIYC